MKFNWSAALRDPRMWLAAQNLALSLAAWLGKLGVVEVPAEVVSLTFGLVTVFLSSAIGTEIAIERETFDGTARSKGLKQAGKWWR